MTEKPKASFSGLPVLIAALLFLGFYFIASIDAKNEASIILGFPLLALVIFVMSGCYKLEPNQAAVLSFFGKYSGTVRDTGLRWNNPLYQKKKISLRVRNFESGRLKVNELDGSPIEIAAVIVWQVEGAAEAVYNVDDYESFVHIQSEAALRAEVARIAREGVGQAELERVKTQWIAGQVYKRDSVMAQAQELGSYWALGLPLDADEKLIERLRAVTPAQVQAVARQYFGDEQMTAATLAPQSLKNRPRPRPAPAGLRH